VGNQFDRLIRLSGQDGFSRLQQAHVAIVGLGGVGGHACEAIARSGVGTITIIDYDTVDITNLNRQIISTMDVVGEKKVEVMKRRILSINSDAIVNTHDCFLTEENCHQLILRNFDYIVDAIDSLKSKLALIQYAYANDIEIISSMGTGNKWNPAQLEVADIFQTSVDPIARKMRSELKKLGIKKLKVVYSKEQPVVYNKEENYLIGSNAFVPATAGLIMASEVIKTICF
jgi:tRNA A37 threonylcarbamoyladenosine dehydratase